MPGAQIRRPAAIANSGSSGILRMPCRSAISLCRKSRKKDGDRRTPTIQLFTMEEAMTVMTKAGQIRKSYMPPTFG